MKITRGKIQGPKKVLVYGADGIGKTTFAAGAPNPIFLSTESGTGHLDVARFPEVESWEDATRCVAWLDSKEAGEFETLVIDSLDWLETLCWSFVARSKGKNHLEELQYGKGYVFAVEEWRRFIDAIPTRLNVVAIAHQKTVKESSLNGEAIDVVGVKLHDKSAALWREWCDFVFLATREVRATQVEKFGRKIGQSNGQRVLKTQWSPLWQAKSRAALPDTLPLDWGDFVAALDGDCTAIIADINRLVALVDGPTAKKVQSATKDNATNYPKLKAILERLEGMIEK